MDKKNTLVNAVKAAKKIEQIMIYLVTSGCKVLPEEGVRLTDQLLQLSVTLVDDLSEVLDGE